MTIRPLTLSALLTAALLAFAFAAGSSAAGQAAPFKTFKDCAACPAMIALPGGRYMMGAAPDEPWADSREEGPRHEVTIRGFALAATEITFEEWDACVADGGCDGYTPADEGWGRGARPVIHVSLKDAETFAAWLNSKVEGSPYRLPSEAEWEYAARAGADTPFWFGARITPQDANYNTKASYGRGPKARPLWRTAPAKTYKPNPWGFYEMTGNVWEWTSDCWHWSYEGAPSDGSRRATGDCKEAPMRGGSWDERPHHLRSANRFYLPIDRRRSELGFRIARDLP